jgi:hypothetical protein
MFWRMLNTNLAPLALNQAHMFLRAGTENRKLDGAGARGGVPPGRAMNSRTISIEARLP